MKAAAIFPSRFECIRVTDNVPRPADDQDSTLQPPQFTLRALLLWTTAAAVLLAVLMAIGAFWAAALLFLLALVAAHVIGNSLGTRLRDGRQPRVFVREPRSLATHAQPAPSGRLRERKGLHWINLVFTGAGAIAAGYFGGRALAEIYPDATAAAIVVAHVSSGVLGGFAGFVVTSFLAVLRQGLSEAHAASDAHRPTKSIRRQ
jgi:hypothetical protein